MTSIRKPLTMPKAVSPGLCLLRVNMVVTDLLLEQRVVVELLGDEVRPDEQDESDDGLDQVDRRRVGEAVVDQAGLIHVIVDYRTGIGVELVAEHENLVEVGVEDVADRQDEQDRDRAHDGRQRDVAHLLEAPRPVDRGRLVQLGRHAADGRKIDDRRPAELLPYIRDDDDGPEILRFGQISNRGIDYMKRQQNFVDDADIRQPGGEDAAQDDPAQKVRQVGDRLRPFLEDDGPDFVQQQRENNRERKSDDQLDQADAERILDDGQQHVVVQEFLEIVEADPGRHRHRENDVVFLECDDDAVHRNVVENDHPGDAEQRHDLQIPLAVQLSQPFLPISHACGCPNGRRLHLRV
ncbi:hypothetical protein BN871_AN_00370 [Paenibacillus sp. P22]|nr:hypothetical protein BN871_AN_00370 [Paenibacillus sp. P22]